MSARNDILSKYRHNIMMEVGYGRNTGFTADYTLEVLADALLELDHEHNKEMASIGNERLAEANENVVLILKGLLGGEKQDGRS